MCGEILDSTPLKSICQQNECSNPIFQSKDEMNRSLSRLCYGKFDVIGRVWMEVMRKALVGGKMCLVPTVHAKAAESCPRKPPKMRYKDLSIYDRPHYEYKTYLEDKEFECLGRNKKLLQCYLYPTVADYRKRFSQSICEVREFMKEAFCEVKRDLQIKEKEFLCMMRDPCKLQVRRGLVASAIFAGWVLGSRKHGYIYRKTFWASIGGMITGYMCFPDETDQAIREVSYKAGEAFLLLYNFWYGTSVNMGRIGPCEWEKPPCPPKRTVPAKFACPPKVEKKKPPKAAPPPPPPPPQPEKKLVCRWE